MGGSVSKSYMGDLAKAAGNEFGMLVDDGIFGGDVTQWIDTGSYVFNALLSGSIYGGLPANKITAIAGESATGKTFFTLGLVKHFLDMNPTGGCIYFESESALTSDMLKERGIDTTRVYHMPVATVEEFRHQAVKILEKHGEVNESERPPLMMCLDSLGMLSTTKEVADISSDSGKRDMTKAQVIKGAFRVLTLMLAKVNVPFIVTNHVYDQIGTMFPQKVMGGGSAMQYAASSIVFLSKRKEKDGTEVIGNIIHCKMQKSRLTKENKKVDVLLTYRHGLSKYYGLLEMAEAAGVFKKVSTRFELPDGSKLFGKQILKDPEKHFTEDILKQLDNYAKIEYTYGITNGEEDDGDDPSDAEEVS
jgi:RecA/RadA recombinase